MCQSLTSDLLKCAARLLQQSHCHENVHQCACDGSSSCKYPVQGLTLIYSLPQFVLVHGVQIFIQSEVMIHVVTGTDGVGLSAGAISTERKKTNMHTVMNIFISAPFLRFL